MSKTPITDAAEYELQEAYDGYDGLSSAPTKVVNPESMRALELKYNEVKAKLEVHENDLQLAAGELMLPLPEPGSNMARVCGVNRLLKYEIGKLISERNNLKAIIKDDCDTDSRAREIALKVLPMKSVHGDSYGVPTLMDIVEQLVLRIEGLNKILKIYDDQYVHKNEVGKIRGELDSALRQLECQKRLVKESGDKIIRANDILEEIKGSAHGRALLGGTQDTYLWTILKIDSLAGQALANLNKNEK
jgi:hypothetical protein